MYDFTKVLFTPNTSSVLCFISLIMTLKGNYAGVASRYKIKSDNSRVAIKRSVGQIHDGEPIVINLVRAIWFR